MILVQNLQQLLSGSKFLLVLLLSVLVATSCSVKKVATTDRSQVSGKRQGQVSGKLDTVNWRVLKETEKPPIRTGAIGGSMETESTAETPADMGIKKGTYNVSIFLPMRANTNSINELNTRYVNYYGGTMLALRELESQGVSLNVDIFDTNRDETTFLNQLKSFENNNADLIIGPYDKDLLVKAAEYGKENEVVVVSPWQSRSGLAKENPYYIQLRPGLANYYRMVMAHAKNEFEDSQIILIGGDSDTRKLSQFQFVNKEIEGRSSASRLREFIMDKDSLFQAETVFGDLFLDNQPKVFIFGNTSPNDDDFLYQCMRRINIEKGECKVVVYGMPVMLDSEKIKNEFNQNVGLRVCRSKFVDRSIDNIKSFERNYYREYGDLPSDDAFEGYDVMMYLGQAIHKYGTGFQHSLYMERDKYLQATYSVDKKSKSGSENFNTIEYFENRHLDIIEFRDNRFQRTR